MEQWVDFSAAAESTESSRRACPVTGNVSSTVDPRRISNEPVEQGRLGADLPAPTVSGRISEQNLALQSLARQWVKRNERVEQGRLGANLPAPTVSGRIREQNLVRQNQVEILIIQFGAVFCCCSVLFVLLGLVGFAFWIWVIVGFAKVNKNDEPCSAPLIPWAIGAIAFGAVMRCECIVDRFICCWHPSENGEALSPPRRVVLKNWLFFLFNIGWMMCFGIYVVNKGAGEEPSCKQVMPELHLPSRVYVYFVVAAFIFLHLNACGIVFIFGSLHRRGYLNTAGAAPSGAFEENTVEVPYTDINVEENPSCAICFENWNRSAKIVRTRDCKHFYHKQCLKNWLKAARTCPICRLDLGCTDKDRDVEVSTEV